MSRLKSLGLVVVCLLAFPEVGNGQQDWSTQNQTYQGPAGNATDPSFQGPQFSSPTAQPQFGQQPFANQPQQFNNIPSQVAQTPMVPQGTFVPEVTGESEPESDAKLDLSPDAIADDLAEGAEHAKNTFMRAMFENDRAAQIDLATKYLLPIAVICFVMVIANWIGNRLRDKVSGLVSNRVDLTLGRFAGTMCKFFVVSVALMSVLAYYGAELTSLAALIAALGFAVGLALQGTLGNFASGIALLVFRPFNVGDYIIVGGSEGTVQAIELFTTSIDTLDNRRIILPNDNVFGNRIENWTLNETRRVDVLVGVAYSADMKKTRQVLTNAMASVEGALPTPSPEVYLNELNSSSVDWSCRVWCRPEEYLAVKEHVTEAAKNALDQNGIGIPFPQLDLHVVTPKLEAQQRSKAA